MLPQICRYGVVPLILKTAGCCVGVKAPLVNWGDGTVACGNGKVSRAYLSSHPTPPSAALPAHVRPPGVPPKKVGEGSVAPKPQRDTSVDSPDRDWDMKGVVRYDRQWLTERGAHIYFGGLDGPDGDGHGHGYIDDQGNFTVFRDPYDPAGGKAARRAATHTYCPPVRKK